MVAAGRVGAPSPAAPPTGGWRGRVAAGRVGARGTSAHGRGKPCPYSAWHKSALDNTGTHPLQRRVDEDGLPVYTAKRDPNSNHGGT